MPGESEAREDFDKWKDFKNPYMKTESEEKSKDSLPPPKP